MFETAQGAVELVDFIGFRHGFSDIEPGFTMLDPITATILTPGLDVAGTFGETGIPAAVLTRYLAEHGAKLDMKNKQGRTPLDVAQGVGGGTGRAGGGGRGRGAGPSQAMADLLRSLMAGTPAPGASNQQ